ncbi:MAG: hypothetical protein ABFD18_13885 [Syntrophomonas sp.]
MLTRKAVVVETGKGWAIILLPGGEYKRVKTNQYLEVGELYQYRNYAAGKYLAAAAIFLTILFGTIDYYTVQAYAEVSSLELGLNRWGRVVAVQAKNDEGQRIISQVQIKNEPLENAVQKISRIVEKEKPNGIGMNGKPLVKIHAKGKAKPELEEKLLKKIEQKQEKETPVKNKNEKKQELKNERKFQNLNENNSNGRSRQESPEKPEPVGNNNGAGSKPNNHDLVKQTDKAKLNDEELIVDKAEPSTQTIEVVPQPPKSGENKDNGNNEKNNENKNKTNQDNKKQDNSQKDDNNRKNQGKR